MPELPEVETIIRDLKKSQFRNNRITDIQVDWPKSLKEEQNI